MDDKKLVAIAIGGSGYTLQHGIQAEDIYDHYYTKRYTKDAAEKISAANAYVSASAAAYLSAKDKEAAKRYVDAYLPGYAIDDVLSSPDHVVLHNDSAKKLIVAYRGTDVGNASDLSADVTIAKDGVSYKDDPRFTQAVWQYQMATVKYNDYDAKVTGHSLGGSQAAWVSRETGAEAHVFNPGMVGMKLTQDMSASFGYLKAGGQYDNMHIYRMDGDVVSGGYTSRISLDQLDERGIPMRQSLNTSWKDKNGDSWSTYPESQEMRRYAPTSGHGAELVNAKFDDPQGRKGVDLAFAAHKLNRFMSDKEAKDYKAFSDGSYKDDQQVRDNMQVSHAPTAISTVPPSAPNNTVEQSHSATHNAESEPGYKPVTLTYTTDHAATSTINSREQWLNSVTHWSDNTAASHTPQTLQQPSQSTAVQGVVQSIHSMS